MMMGGGMLGLGLLTMLMVVGLPILAVVGLIVALRDRSGRPPAMSPPPAPTAVSPPASGARFCAHCGYGLEAAWTHCPNCGAPRLAA